MTDHSHHSDLKLLSKTLIYDCRVIVAVGSPKMQHFIVVFVIAAFDTCTSSSTPFDTTEELQSASDICRPLIQLDIHSFMQQITNCARKFLHETDGAPAYQKFFQAIFTTAGLKARPAFFRGCNLIVKIESRAHYIFELRVDDAAENALSQIEKYKDSFFYRETDVFCVGINFRYDDGDGAERLLVCNWIANLYAEEGTLKKSFPEVKLLYAKNESRLVNIKRKSVFEYYKILEQVGSGGFAEVYKCVEKKSGKIFAAKFVPSMTSHVERNFYARDEIDLMNQFHHPKLLSLHDVFERKDEFVLIVEYLEGGNLFRRKTNYPYIESEAEVINYVRQICEAIKYLHDRSILHLDIRPDNIICRTNLSKEIKLIDFGLARKLTDGKIKVAVSLGATYYVAPEILEHKPLGFYTDMWSVGVVSYFLLSGYYPFCVPDKNENLKENIKACAWEFEENAFRNISDDGKNFIKRLLIKNKRKRMTVRECLNHPWLAKNNSGKIVATE